MNFNEYVLQYQQNQMKPTVDMGGDAIPSPIHKAIRGVNNEQSTKTTNNSNSLIAVPSNETDAGANTAGKYLGFKLVNVGDNLYRLENQAGRVVFRKASKEVIEKNYPGIFEELKPDHLESGFSDKIFQWWIGIFYWLEKFKGFATNTEGELTPEEIDEYFSGLAGLFSSIDDAFLNLGSFLLQTAENMYGHDFTPDIEKAKEANPDAFNGVYIITTVLSMIGLIGSIPKVLGTAYSSILNFRLWLQQGAMVRYNDAILRATRSARDELTGVLGERRTGTLGQRILGDKLKGNFTFDELLKMFDDLPEAKKIEIMKKQYPDADDATLLKHFDNWAVSNAVSLEEANNAYQEVKSFIEVGRNWRANKGWKSLEAHNDLKRELEQLSPELASKLQNIFEPYVKIRGNKLQLDPRQIQQASPITFKWGFIPTNVIEQLSVLERGLGARLVFHFVPKTIENATETYIATSMAYNSFIAQGDSPEAAWAKAMWFGIKKFGIESVLDVIGHFLPKKLRHGVTNKAELLVKIEEALWVAHGAPQGQFGTALTVENVINAAEDALDSSPMLSAGGASAIPLHHNRGSLIAMNKPKRKRHWSNSGKSLIVR